jgi:hypothetical protein
MGLLGAVVAASACGVSQSNIGDNSSDSTQDGAALSSTSRTYVAVRTDSSGSGYWVHDVNRVSLSETLVSGLDFSGSQLYDDDQAIVFEALSDVVLHGKLGPADHHTGLRPFMVTEAYRGMPGKTPASTDAFYKVADVNIECVTTPCPSMSATRVNYSPVKLFHVLSLDAMGLIDQTWLSARTTSGNAIAAGALAKSGSTWTLTTSNVYVQLPERTACPELAAPRCGGNDVRTFTRSADRCVMPATCVSPGPCSELIPGCGDGYTLASWKAAPNGCSHFVCDPSWLAE